MLFGEMWLAGYRRAVTAEGMLRVAVLTHYQLIRVGLAGLIDADMRQVEVVRVQAENEERASQPDPPDVVVYDLAALDSDGVHELRRLVAAPVPVVGLARDGRPDLTRVASALGVAETVTEETNAVELVDILARVAGRPLATPVHPELDHVGLTPRERSILRLIGSGASNLEIAEELHLSRNTVKTNVRNTYKKIGVETRPRAVLWAIRNGLSG